MTIGLDFFMKKVELSINSSIINIDYQIWDPYGHTFNQVRPLYYQGSHGALVVYDVTRRNTYDNIVKWVAGLKENSTKNVAIPIILLVNKIDLRSNGDTSVTTEEGEKLARKLSHIYFNSTRPVPYIETSAVTGENVELAFLKIGELIFQSFKE